MKQLRRIIKYSYPYKSQIILAFILNLLYALFNVLTVLGFIPVLGILFGTTDKVTSPVSYKGLSNITEYAQGNLNYQISTMIHNGNALQALQLISVIVIVLFLLKNLFSYWSHTIFISIEMKSVRDLKKDLYKKYLYLPLAFFSANRKGDAISRLTSDIDVIQASYLSSLLPLLRAPITVLFVIISMFSMSFKLTLFIFILLPISGLIITSISKKLKSDSLKVQNENVNYLSIIEESLSSIRIIKGFTAEKIFLDKFKTSANKLADHLITMWSRYSLASPLSEFLGTLTIVIILLYGGNLVLSNQSDLTPQEFFAYIGLFYLMLPPIKSFTSALYSFKKGAVSVDRVLHILKTNNPLKAVSYTHLTLPTTSRV